MSDENVINFYSVNDTYGELSNFAAFPITLQGKRWPTSEHYFQVRSFRTRLIEKRSARRDRR